MAKMYYNEAEAAEKLGVAPTELIQMARDGKLHAYADGANKMFKVAEVDALAPAPDEAGGTSALSDIQLAPVEMSGTHAAIDLSETRSGDSSEVDVKSDTVITSQGISIFDDEDLDIEPADPMAKTQIAPSLEEGMGLDNVSGGSGLLDLTRESDDTSLGAEVLDHIDMESGEQPMIDSVAERIGRETEEAPTAVVDVQAVPDMPDPSAAIFSAMAGVGMVISLLLAAVAIGLLTSTQAEFVTKLAGNLPIVTGALFGAVVIAALVGMMAGKKSAPQGRSGA